MGRPAKVGEGFCGLVVVMVVLVSPMLVALVLVALGVAMIALLVISERLLISRNDLKTDQVRVVLVLKF